jgi:hypothetical protein
MKVKDLLEMNEDQVRAYFSKLSEADKEDAFEALVKHLRFFHEEMRSLARDCLHDVFIDDSSALAEGYDLPG